MWKVPLLRLRALTGKPVARDEVDGRLRSSDEVLASPVPVIVDFWAPWCRPCEAIEPHLRRSPEAWGGRVRLVRVERRRGSRASPRRYGVLSLPTVILFSGGEPQATVYGAQSRERYERAFAPFV